LGIKPGLLVSVVSVFVLRLHPLYCIALLIARLFGIRSVHRGHVDSKRINVSVCLLLARGRIPAKTYLPKRTRVVHGTDLLFYCIIGELNLDELWRIIIICQKRNAESKRLPDAKRKTLPSHNKDERVASAVPP
jgi:hypothetical protein